MKVKDKLTDKILTTTSIWLMKEWKKNPKRYLTEWKEKKQKKEVEENGLCNK